MSIIQNNQVVTTRRRIETPPPQHQPPTSPTSLLELLADPFEDPAEVFGRNSLGPELVPPPR